MSKLCEHCGGDGYNDLYDDNICAVCGGSGEIWDDAEVPRMTGIEQPTKTKPDGYRPRKKRPKGWLDKAIKDGSVRDPKLGPEPEQVYGDDATVIQPPTATLTVEGTNGSNG